MAAERNDSEGPGVSTGALKAFERVVNQFSAYTAAAAEAKQLLGSMPRIRVRPQFISCY